VCGQLIEARGDHLALDSGVAVDVQAFTARARRLVNHDPVGDNDLDVNALLTGDLLPGWYEDW